MKKTLVTLSIKDDVNQSEAVPNLLFFAHYKESNYEYFHLTDEAKEWPIQQAKEYIGLIYEEHFKFLLPNNNWKKAFISEREKQSLDRLFSKSFVPIPEKPPHYQKDYQKERINQRKFPMK